MKNPSPYGRSRQKSFSPAHRYEGETYYDRPSVKPSHYGWKIVVYFFVGGLAGAAQIVATVADLFGGKQAQGVVKRGRLLALLGSLISPVLLIADLHVPQRWYNMVRIFRKSSPMSLGVYILSVFGLFSGLTAVFGWFNHKLARLTQIPAALAGMGMSIYTGVLLTATSTPLWAALPKRLPALFGVSAAATAVSALSLAEQAKGEAHTVRKLELLALIVGTAELILTQQTEQELAQKGVDGVLHEEPWQMVNEVGVKGAGVLLPFVLRLVNVWANGRFSALSGLASVGTLVGGLLLRALFVLAGNESARRPRDYFQLTQPGVQDE